MKNNPSFFDAVEKFKDEITALGAYEIGSCNAADPDNGYCFTEAVCTLKPTRHKLAFANIFFDAFVMLKNFLTKKEIPTDDGKRVVLERLVKFLLNTGEKMTHISCITGIMVAGFTHLLSDKDVDLLVNNVNLLDNNVDL